MSQTETPICRGGTLLRLGALLGVLAVGLGAFGAHGLEARLEDAIDAEKRLGWWQTAAHYHLVHAVAICAVVAALEKRARGAVIAFALGIALFSGSLYAMTLGAPSKLGLVTPIGGACLMVGWALVAWQAPQMRRPRDQ